jgi:membrane protein
MWRSLRGVHAASQRHFSTLLAASIAFQAVFSTIPLVCVFLAAAGLVLRDPDRQRRLLDQALIVFPVESSRFIADSIRGISEQSGTLTTLALVGLVWSASNLFGAIRTALNVVWEVHSPRSFVVDKLLDLGATAGLGVLVAGSVAGTLLVRVLQSLRFELPGGATVGASPQVAAAMSLAVPAAFTVLAFLFLYRFVPNVRHGFRDVAGGTLVATLLFEIAKHGFTFYVSRFSFYRSVSGVIGDLMLFMLWTWVSAIILLIGAEVAAESSRRRHGHAIEAHPAAHPEDPAVPALR